jgi:hypothetical protein
MEFVFIKKFPISYEPNYCPWKHKNLHKSRKTCRVYFLPVCDKTLVLPICPLLCSWHVFFNETYIDIAVIAFNVYDILLEIDSKYSLKPYSNLISQLDI